MLFVCCLATLLLMGFASSQHLNGAECMSDPTAPYAGNHSTTRSGLTCQRWDASFPHVARFIPLDGAAHNYCRNPDHDIHGPWCYTTDPGVRWQYCDVPLCDDGSMIIWAEQRQNLARIRSIPADPRMISESLSEPGVLRADVLATSGQEDSHYVDVTGSFSEKTIFYVDTKSESIEMMNFYANATTQFMVGKAKNFRALAYDWLRQNLYWTDDVMRWVMVSDVTLSYYWPVYMTNQGSPRALALDAHGKRLFFSIDRPVFSQVMSTDLGGADPRVIFSFPEVFYVTSIAVDISDQRLYVGDHWGLGSLLVSSDFNGNNKRHHYFRRSSKFVGISAHLDFVYMVDAIGRDEGGKHIHSMWLKNKRSQEVLQYDFEGEPQSMIIISPSDEVLRDEDFGPGECESMDRCEHICLPHVNRPRECVCSLGYTKVSDTQCVRTQYNDSVILIADAGQRRLFEVSLVDEGLSFVELEQEARISVMATNPLTGRIYASDKIGNSDEDKKPIKSYDLQGREIAELSLQNMQATNIDVDAMTGNIYFSDSASQSIYITDERGVVIKEITTEDRAYWSDVTAIALDLRNKKVYWTSTNLVEGLGQVWRSNMDGTGTELVLDGLNWPGAIHVNYQRDSLFVCEAKTMTAYEIPMMQLHNVTTPSHVMKTTYDLRGGAVTTSAGKAFVIDMKTHNNVIYFAERHQLWKYVIDTKTTHPVRSRIFYDITSISIIDSSAARLHIDSFNNPCSGTSCRNFCIPRNNRSYICAN